MDDIMAETGQEIREQEEEEARESSTTISEGSEERSSSGFINHFLPNLACEKEVEEKRENEKDEEKIGGIITHLISNFVSPVSPKAGDFSSSNGTNDDLGNGGGGGVMKEIISNMFHHSEEEKVKDNGEGRDEAKEEKGGFIDSIVSHFPTSIPDDAVPTTTEASILINSIVKD